MEENQDPVPGQSRKDKLETGENGYLSENKHSVFMENKAENELDESGNVSPSKCCKTCLTLYSVLATIIIVILSILLLMREDSAHKRYYYQTESLKQLEHDDTVLSELSKALISPFNEGNDDINDDDNNRKLLLPATCEGDWYLDHEVWFNYWARRRVSDSHLSKTTAENYAKWKCINRWETCFYGPIVEASQEMERQLANDPEHGGNWECENSYHINAYPKGTYPDDVVGPWCSWSWQSLTWTCYADCYAECHYVHKCNRLSC